MVLALAAVIFLLRRPDAITDPKLWGEDGAIFLPDSFLQGVGSLLKPYAGYVLLLPRLWAEVTTALPIRWLALSYTAFALTFAFACCSLLLSRRLRWLIPGDGLRLAGFLALLLLPGLSEIYGTMTNAGWFAGIALLLLSLSSEPLGRRGRGAEGAAVVLLGLTGISIFLVSFSFILRWLRQRTSYNRALLAVVGVVAGLQAWTTATAGRTVPDFSLQLGSVLHALVFRPAATVLLGEQRIGQLYLSASGRRIVLVTGAVVLVGVVFALRALTVEARWALVSVMAVSAALVTVHFGGDLSDATRTTVHGRYLVLPITALYVVLIAGGSRLIRRRAGIAAVGLACLASPAIASLSDWELPPYRTIDWPASARCISEHRQCTVPLNPPGWSATLPPLPNVR